MAGSPGAEYFDAQQGSAGSPVGPRLNASLFVPPGYNVVFLSDATATERYWALRLARNSDGTEFVGTNGKPTLELIEVKI